MRRSIRPLAVALVLSGCGGGGGAHEARYTGALPGCGLAAATLTRLAGTIMFSPGDGVLTIQGTIAKDGSFSGTLNTQPPDKAPFLLSVHGTIGDESVVIDYATPRCHAHATFARVHPSLL